MMSEPSPKRQRTFPLDDSEPRSSPQLIKDPCSILTWNANGLASNTKSSANLELFRSLLHKTTPQLVCIQEARLRCRSPGSRGSLHPSELEAVRPFLQCISQTYEPVWSLADKRHAGTLMLIHHNLCYFPGKDDVSEEHLSIEMIIQNNCAFSVPGAIDLLLRVYNLTGDKDIQVMLKDYETVSESNRMEIQPKKKAQQTSMKAFFQTKQKSNNDSGANEPPKQSRRNNRHQHEGRIQFIRFANMDVLHTYVPNNGMKPESFQRRRQFDQDMQYLLAVRRKILEKVQHETQRPILWVGDLNVARTHLDGTHYSYKNDRKASFRGESGSVEEYWTNEAKCLDVGKRSSITNKKDPGDVGIAGFTPNERKRFEQVLHKAKMVDVWRHLHPNGVTDEKVPCIDNCRGGTLEKNPWDKAEYTWRGSIARNNSTFKAKYQGKGQRIDYFLLSESALDIVDSCDILGYGEFREGFFCGSDHCASLLQLNTKSRNEGQIEGTESSSKSSIMSS